MRQAEQLDGGPLSRVASWVYRVVVLEVALLITCAPTVAAALLLTRDPSNVPLYALALVPVAPALAAGLYALRAWLQQDGLTPARPFWRGYRRNVVDALRWWLPALVVATVLGVTVANADAVPTAATFRPLAVVLLVVLALLCGHLLTITSQFAFRTRDAWRIATTEILRSWRTTLGLASLLVVAAGVAYVGNEAVLLLLAWAFCLMLRLVGEPLVRAVEDRYVAHD